MQVDRHRVNGLEIRGERGAKAGHHRPKIALQQRLHGNVVGIAVAGLALDVKRFLIITGSLVRGRDGIGALFRKLCVADVATRRRALGHAVLLRLRQRVERCAGGEQTLRQLGCDTVILNREEADAARRHTQALDSKRSARSHRLADGAQD